MGTFGMKASLSDLLQSMRLAHGDFAIVDIASASGFRLFDSTNMILYLVLAGEAQFRFPAANHLTTAAAGEFLFAPAGTGHSVWAGAGVGEPAALCPFNDAAPRDQPELLQVGRGAAACRILCCALEIDRTRHESLIRLLPEIRRYRERKGPAKFAATPLLTMQAIDEASSGPGASAFLLIVAELLLMHAMRDSLVRGASPATGIGIPDSPQIAAALRLIYEHPERDWSVATLAREVGMSRAVFAASFAARLDETPMHYVTRVRMMRAERLLRDGHRSLPEIAHLTGYDSETAFARAFKREFGKTPGDLRREVRSRREQHVH
jgi:AraC-like DNA-binding protein